MSNVFVFRRPPHGVITEYFGGGKGGSTTTTNNVTQIPPEVLARYNAVNARAETVAQAPYQAYSQDPNAFVAPLSQTQQAGIQNTNTMAGAAQPYYGAATGLAAQSTGSVNPSGLNVGQYMNPYTQSVVNATQAAMNQQQGQQLSQQQAEAIKGGAFGGERAGLQRAQLMGQQGLAQAQAIAPLYQQNYNQALAAAQQQQGVGLGAEQANRQNLQNAAQLFGSIGTNAQQAGLAGAQAQMQAGQQQQQTQQAGLQALYNQFQQQQGFPYQQAQFLANIAEGTGALSGNATSGTSTTTGGGGFFSDERLKENIQRVGETDDGQPIYRYNYKGDKNTQIGLLAQDVEKHHPEAVGSSQGYKTVDYKKATEDAIHKEDGGALSGTDAYSIGAPSAMLRENSGKGLGAMPSLPQAFMGGRDIPIETGANAAGLAAMRSPAVTGFAPGVREGKQAELASLQSSIANPGPNSNLLGSGPEYLQSRVNTLQDWLNQNNSQGGLVGPQGGSFARGGLADGGYMNPALAYYSPQQAQQGVFQLQPNQQRQILQGQQMQTPQRPQQPDAVTSAMNMAKLVEMGNKARPDFLRSDADVKARAQTAEAIKAREVLDIGKARKLEEAGGDGYGSPEEGDDLARGGVAGGRHHYSLGGGNPYGSLGGGNDLLGDTIKEQDVSRRISGDKATPPPQPKQQSGGLGDIASAGLKAKGIYDMGSKGGSWAAGKLGLGEASPTAMSATSTEAVPGVAGGMAAPAAGGVVPEVAAPVIPEAVIAAAPETLVAAAPEALTAVAGGAEAAAAAAAAAEAAAAASAMDFLPFLLLKRGGVVPRRHHFDDGGFLVPDEYSTAEPGLAGAEGGDEVAATGGDSGETTTIGRTAPAVRPARPATLGDAVEPVRAAAPPKPSKSFLPEITSEGVRDTLSSENFWVPALAGLGSMLASPNKTLAGAIGSGLVGGTGAYTEMQKQNALQTKQRFELAKDLFKGPVEGDDKKLYWRHVPSGKLVPQEEYERLYSDFVRGSAGTPRSTAPSSDTPAVATARSVIAEEPPKPIKAPTVPPASAAATAEAPAPVTPPVQPPAAAAPVQGEAPLKNKAQIKNEMLANPQAWADAPPEGNPILLRQKAAKMESEVAELRAKARRIATTMPENTTEGTRLTAEANQLDNNRKEYIDRSNQILNDAAELAYDRQLKLSQGRIAQEIGRGKVPTTPSVKLPEGMTVAEAETNPDRLGDRIKFNMDNYAELKARGEIDEANKYLAAADKDRDRLATLIGTEFTTSSDTVYKINPQAPVYNVTKPKALPADYKSNIDPNTGAVVSKPISEFVGYPETGGHPVDPQLIGKKVIVKEGTDKKKTNSIAQSNEAEKEFVNGAEKAQEAIATTLKFSTAAKILEAKGANTTKAEMSNLARGLGLDLLADQILSAKDETAAFIALKTNVDQAIQQASAAFPRITQNEFAVTKKEATASIDAPFGASYSLAQTQMARALWQNALLSDWEKEKRMSGTTNFNAFRDVWQRAHPKGMFEESAARALGNFKGQDLPKKTEFTEGVVYVMPKNAGTTKLGEAFIKKGLRPGDLFVMNGVNHQEGDFGEPTRVSPTEAYKVHLRAPVLTYGAR
jgi:hypothetical protein